MTTTLTCVFKDNLGAAGFINIEAPKEGLTPAEVTEFMEGIIEENIFISDIDDEETHFESIIGAFLIHKVV